jgi:hypothetical protein
MFPSISIDVLHRLFDVMENKPTDWFWIPTDGALALLSNMHIDNGDSSDEAGKAINKQRDPETVCPFPLFLEKC